MASTRQPATKTASSPARKATSTRQRGVPARASRKALGGKVTLRQPNGGTRAAAAPRVAKSATVRQAGRARPVGEAAAEVREGVARSLKGLMAVEAEIATLVRRTVANGLPDGAATTKELVTLVREVVAGAIEGTEKAGTELVVSIKGIAKGVTMGVNDIRADLGKAAAETVRLAVKHAGRLRTDVAAVAERAGRHRVCNQRGRWQCGGSLEAREPGGICRLAQARQAQQRHGDQDPSAPDRRS